MKLHRLALFLLTITTPFSTAFAVPIPAFISGCDATSCTVAPNGGPVSVDPTGFTLEVDFTPEHIELIEPFDDRGEWLLQLVFDLTGLPDGTEDFGDIDLIEMDGGPILDLNVQFDDQDNNATELVANYEIFGPDTFSSFFVHGFNLALSSVDPLPGNLVTLDFAVARFTVRQGAIDQGVWVSEPSTLALLGLGLLGVGYARRRRLQ